MASKAKRKVREDASSCEQPDAMVSGGLPVKSAKSTVGDSPKGESISEPLSQQATATKQYRSAAAAAAAADEADTSAEQEQDCEWRSEGSAYIARGILRTVVDDDGQLGEGWGKIMGWLSPEESDFTDEKGNPAALWHVIFDDAALGEEDLEEHEVKAAVIAWELATRELSRGGKKKPKAGGNGKAKKGVGSGDSAGPAQAPKDVRVYFVEDADGDKGLPQLALELNVDPDEIVRLNCERYRGLKNAPSCRLKPHTVLVLPTLTPSLTSDITKPSRDPTQQEHPTHETAQVVAASSIVPASAPATAPTVLKAPAIDSKAALLLLQTERNAISKAAGGSGATSHSGAAGESNGHARNESRGTSDIGSGHKTDWLMAMRPNLTFPPFPGVTEDMGVISREYIQHFYCPFVKKQGITYAATGYEAVAPVTAEVEDNWAECDTCQKWRRLPGTFIVADGAPFQCADADRSCKDAEDDWNDEDELEVENEQGAVLSSALQNLEIDGLEVLNLGQIQLSKGYWNEKCIFPVGYRSRRMYWDAAAVDAAKSETKIQYECAVEATEKGPLFSVTPVDANGEFLCCSVLLQCAATFENRSYRLAENLETATLRICSGDGCICTHMYRVYVSVVTITKLYLDVHE